MMVADLIVCGLLAVGPQASGSASVEASTDSGTSAESSGRYGWEAGGEPRPMRRWAPERNTFELGVWGGLLITNREHEFYDPRVAAHLEYRRVAPDLGLRFAYFPLAWLGGEFEVGVMPTRTEADSRATLYAIRGHGIVRAPWWRLAPFIVVGGGGMGVGSASSALGRDIDASFHWGPGAEFFINQRFAVRLDLRHLVGARQLSNNGAASHFEALLGFSVTFGRKKKEATKSGDPDRDGYYGDDDKCPDEPGTYPDGCPDLDSDGDGVANTDDECPDEPGPAPTGCPRAVDSDGDGVDDNADQCPNEPGTKPHGCPPDSDGDGIRDPEDQCPDLAGDPPDGCPPDTDGDGVYDPVDDCLKEPETKNSYEDDDGCPDEVPQQLRGATGTMQGIQFEVNSAKITADSKPALDSAVATLKDNPKYSVEVVGHSDSTGERDHNIELSSKRAKSVADYLSAHGIEEERVSTRGAGPDEPIADNETEEGRAQNRRIEFKVRRRLRGRR